MREQFLEERVEYFREVQRLLYVVALNQEAATKPHLVKALCMADPNLGDKQAGCPWEGSRPFLKNWTPNLKLLMVYQFRAYGLSALNG